MKKHIIAIDGPSGSGKSTIAKALAETLDYLYIDTGALYRTVGLYMRENSIDPADEEKVCAALDGIKISVSHTDGAQHVYLNGADVSETIRENEISAYASKVSKFIPVRDFLLGIQRSAAKENDVILDGRDIGTVIFPDADVKIFLTASAEVRAKRRYKELIEKGQTIEYEKVLEDMKMRDRRDTEREIAPLKKADDAIELDNGEMSLNQSVEAALTIIKGKLG